MEEKIAGEEAPMFRQEIGRRRIARRGNDRCQRATGSIGDRTRSATEDEDQGKQSSSMNEQIPKTNDESRSPTSNSEVKKSLPSIRARLTSLEYKTELDGCIDGERRSPRSSC